jgi:hypothetical protein
MRAQENTHGRCPDGIKQYFRIFWKKNHKFVALRSSLGRICLLLKCENNGIINKRETLFFSLKGEMSYTHLKLSW